MQAHARQRPHADGTQVSVVVVEIERRKHFYYSTPVWSPTLTTPPTNNPPLFRLLDDDTHGSLYSFYNHSESEEGTALTEALKHNNTLTVLKCDVETMMGWLLLKIMMMMMGDKAGELLCLLLEEGECEPRIISSHFVSAPTHHHSRGRLDSNNINDDGVKVLAELLKYNTTLTSLTCDDEMRMRIRR